MLTVNQACNWVLLAMIALKHKISPKNDPDRVKDSTYFTIFRKIQQVFVALVQWSIVIYWNVLKSSVHDCSLQPLLIFHSFNTSLVSILYKFSDKWVAGWMG